MMQKLFYISFLFVLITACRNNDNELHQLLTHETDIQQVEYVVVATDTDCINCAFGIAKIIEKQPEVKRLYSTFLLVQKSSKKGHRKRTLLNL